MQDDSVHRRPVSHSSEDACRLEDSNLEGLSWFLALQEEGDLALRLLRIVAREKVITSLQFLHEDVQNKVHHSIQKRQLLRKASASILLGASPTSVEETPRGIRLERHHVDREASLEIIELKKQQNMELDKLVKRWSFYEGSCSDGSLKSQWSMQLRKILEQVKLLVLGPDGAARLVSSLPRTCPGVPKLNLGSLIRPDNVDPATKTVTPTPASSSTGPSASVPPPPARKTPTLVKPDPPPSPEELQRKEKALSKLSEMLLKELARQGDTWRAFRECGSCGASSRASTNKLGSSSRCAIADDDLRRSTDWWDMGGGLPTQISKQPSSSNVSSLSRQSLDHDRESLRASGGLTKADGGAPAILSLQKEVDRLSKQVQQTQLERDDAIQRLAKARAETDQLTNKLNHLERSQTKQELERSQTKQEELPVSTISTATTAASSLRRIGTQQVTQATPEAGRKDAGKSRKPAPSGLAHMPAQGRMTQSLGWLGSLSSVIRNSQHARTACETDSDALNLRRNRDAQRPRDRSASVDAVRSLGPSHPPAPKHPSVGHNERPTTTTTTTKAAAVNPRIPP